MENGKWKINDEQKACYKKYTPMPDRIYINTVGKRRLFTEASVCPTAILNSQFSILNSQLKKLPPRELFSLLDLNRRIFTVEFFTFYCFVGAYLNIVLLARLESLELTACLVLALDVESLFALHTAFC